MNENLPNREISMEHISTPEEVCSVFKELIKKEYKEVRRCEDQEGLYLLEVEVSGESENEVTKYLYIRKGEHKEAACSETEIYVTYFEDNIPVGGTSAARFIEGNWKIL